MSLRYRQGIFVTDNKNRLSSGQGKSSYKQDALPGSAKQKDGLTNSSNATAPNGRASPPRAMCKPFAPGAGIRWGKGQETSTPYWNIPRLLPLSLRKPIDMSTKPVCHLQPTLYFLFHADSSFDKTTDVHLYFQS